MRKKTAFAMALLPNPEVLFLDEPFEAIDPVTSKTMRDLLVTVASHGVTVFLTSAHSVRRRAHRHSVCDDSRRQDGLELIVAGSAAVARRSVFRAGGRTGYGGPGLARTAAILGALWTAVRRDAKSMGSFTGNNLFSVVALSFTKKDRGVFLSLNVLIGLVLFFPLSTDPLRKIPPQRLTMWPISNGERWLLRIASPWLNPMTWLLAIMVLRRSVTMGVWALLAGLFAIGFVVPSLPWVRGRGAWQRLPHFPGPLDQLIRKNLRELLSTLDFYCALLLSAGALIFRMRGTLPHDALFPLTMLVTLTLSSYAQTLFGLDGAGGLTRYRLLPLPGWQILAAKDAAFLLVNVTLCLPLAPLAGLAAALVALSIGHSASVNERREQTRWRFSTGVSFGSGIIQVLIMALLAASTVYASPLMLAPCIAAYVWSTWWYGREMMKVWNML